MKLIALLAAAASVLVLAITGYFILRVGPDDRYASCRETTVAGGTIGGPFELTRTDGTRVTDKDVIEDLTLIYFGFTFCPDACPLDLARNADAVSLLEEQGVMVKPVMITIDPERDTPEVLGEYTKWMHPRMVGLLGTPQELEAAQSAYRVYAAKRGDGEDYVYDHSTFTYLMSPDEGLLTFYRREHSADAMAENISCFAENA